MMGNHVTGHDLRDPLLTATPAAGWVVMPQRCPVCLTDAGQRADPPEDLVEDTVVVQSGRELLAVIES